MPIYDKSGFLIIPVPRQKPVEEVDEIIVINECYCSNGHSLINKRAMFGHYPGILLEAINAEGMKGLVALSPVCGDKSRISLDIDLKDNEILKLRCPVCHASLDIYAPCVCEGELVVMFTTTARDFNNCVGVCNRVGCTHAEIKNEGQLKTLTSYFHF